MRNRMDVVSGVLVRNRQILFSQRTADGKRDFPGHWELPGGKVEAGESHAHALHREFLEEVGLEIQLSSEFPFFDGPIGRIACSWTFTSIRYSLVTRQLAQSCLTSMGLDGSRSPSPMVFLSCLR